MQKIKVLSSKEKQQLIRDYIRTEPSMSDRRIAKSIGASATTVGKIRKEMADINLISVQNGQAAEVSSWLSHPYLLEHPELLDGLTPRQLRAIKAPSVLDLMAERQMTNPVYAQQLLNTRRKEQRKAPQIKITEKDVKIWQADITQGLPELQEEIDLVIVDPPYSLKAVQSGIYNSIAEVSARVLVEGGVCLVMCGQTALPDVLTSLTSNKTLRYHWTLSYVINRSTPPAPAQFKKIASLWKPIIMLVKGKYEGDLVPDLYTAPVDQNDRALHHWGQSEEAMRELIERFSNPGDRILDMMVGGGSSAAASILLNRRFYGCDIDPEAIRITKRRVAQLFGSE